MKVLPYFLRQLGDLMGQFRVPFPEHIPYARKVVLVFYQGPVTFQLFRGKPFDNGIPKGRAAAIFGKGNSRPLCPFFEQLLLVDGTPESDIGPFHFLFSLRPSGAKQDCFCGNKNTS